MINVVVLNCHKMTHAVTVDEVCNISHIHNLYMTVCCAKGGLGLLAFVPC